MLIDIAPEQYAMYGDINVEVFLAIKLSFDWIRGGSRRCG